MLYWSGYDVIEHLHWGNSILFLGHFTSMAGDRQDGHKKGPEFLRDIT